MPRLLAQDTAYVGSDLEPALLQNSPADLTGELRQRQEAGVSEMESAQQEEPAAWSGCAVGRGLLPPPPPALQTNEVGSR